MKKQCIKGNFVKNGFKGSMEFSDGIITGLSRDDNEPSEQVIIPTLNNQHIHLGEGFVLPHNMNLLDYIKYSEKEHSKPTYDRAQIIRQTLQSCVNNGITKINTLGAHQAIMEFPISAQCGYQVMQNDRLGNLTSIGMQGFDAFYKFCLDNNIEPGVFLHSFYTNNKESIKFVQAILDKYDCFLAAHIAEDAESEKLVQQKWDGASSMDLLKRFNLLGKKTTLVHCGHLKEEDFGIIAEKKSKITICPISNRTLNTRYANPLQMNSAGISWTISSDGLASGKTADLIEQAKIVKNDFPQITNEQLLAAITSGQELKVGSDASFLTLQNDCVQSIYIKGDKVL
ncbi:MAG: amidohydrolase family protein [Christensenellaceae bacterium]|jgi:cytosine/adenosine deaminase-related metal-dependent hydrolase|nr:amidohydrolase family protein [Christensenellaceae bacterium]